MCPTSTANLTIPAVTPTSPKRRGRPPKSASATRVSDTETSTNANASVELATSSTSVKRRGRPPKSITATSDTSTSSNTSVEIATSSTSVRRRGHPRKNATATSVSVATTSTIIPVATETNLTTLSSYQQSLRVEADKEIVACIAWHEQQQQDVTELVYDDPDLAQALTELSMDHEYEYADPLAAIVSGSIEVAITELVHPASSEFIVPRVTAKGTSDSCTTSADSLITSALDTTNAAPTSSSIPVATNAFGTSTPTVPIDSGSFGKGLSGSGSFGSANLGHNPFQASSTTSIADLASATNPATTTTSHCIPCPARNIDTLLIIDGTALIFQSFGYSNDFYDFTSQGLEQTAINEFFSRLIEILRRNKTKDVVLVFDRPGGSNYRRKIYPEYKRNRKPADPLLVEQIPIIIALSRALGYSVVTSTEYEADDVIATLVTSPLARNYLIESRDKDFIQLLAYNPNITIQQTLSQTYYNRHNAKDKFGVKPELALDYQAICGDPIDNIPGVKGLSGNTALGLINTYGSIEQIYQRVDNGTLNIRFNRFKIETIAEKLKTYRDDVYMSYQLAKLVTNVPFDYEQLTSTDVCCPDLAEFYRLTYELGLIDLRIAFDQGYLCQPMIYEFSPDAKIKMKKKYPMLKKDHKGSHVLKSRLDYELFARKRNFDPCNYGDKDILAQMDDY